MFKFLEIEEEFEILIFLEKRNLVNQYKKAKSNILMWNFWWNKLVVFAINNHQNG